MELDPPIPRTTHKAVDCGASFARRLAEDETHAAGQADAPLLAACLDGLMRYLLTGCRQHAWRTVLLLERMDAQGVGDEALQTLGWRLGERLRQGDRLARGTSLANGGAGDV